MAFGYPFEAFDVNVKGDRGCGFGKHGEIVGQNVKLESIRAHFWGNEWLIVTTDRRGTIPALFACLSAPFGDVSACNEKRIFTGLKQLFDKLDHPPNQGTPWCHGRMYLSVLARVIYPFYLSWIWLVASASALSALDSIGRAGGSYL